MSHVHSQRGRAVGTLTYSMTTWMSLGVSMTSSITIAKNGRGSHAHSQRGRAGGTLTYSMTT